MRRCFLTHWMLAALLTAAAAPAHANEPTPTSDTATVDHTATWVLGSLTGVALIAGIAILADPPSTAGQDTTVTSAGATLGLAGALAVSTIIVGVTRGPTEPDFPSGPYPVQLSPFAAPTARADWVLGVLGRF